MKLPGRASEAWRKHREALHRIAGDAAELSRLLLGGGTILGARWNHRESIDIDMLLPGRQNVDDLRPGRRLDLAAAVGGRIIREKEHRITVRTPEGIIDITAMDPTLRGCERAVEVEGRTETVLSTAQILRGKLDRIRRALPRDAFDLITAAKAEPMALEIAVNSLSERDRVTAREHLERGNRDIASIANDALAGVPEHYRTPIETMGLDAAKSLQDHEYERVQVYRTDEGIVIRTFPRHGTPGTMQQGHDPRAALRDSGIGKHLDANTTVSSYEVERALTELARTGKSGLVLDTGDENPRARPTAMTTENPGDTRTVKDGRPDNVVRDSDRAVGGGERKTPGEKSSQDRRNQGKSYYDP